jgi:hypothetical protein
VNEDAAANAARGLFAISTKAEESGSPRPAIKLYVIGLYGVIMYSDGCPHRRSGASSVN